MKLIDDWKAAHKFLSVRVGAVGAALLVGWMAIPSEQQHALLNVIGLNTPAVFGVIGIVVAIATRVVAQPPPKD